MFVWLLMRKKNVKKTLGSCLQTHSNRCALTACLFVDLNHGIAAIAESFAAWDNKRNKRLQHIHAQKHATKGLKLRGVGRNRFKNPVLMTEWRNGNGHFKLVLSYFQALIFCKLTLQLNDSYLGARKEYGRPVILIVPTCNLWWISKILRGKFVTEPIF